MIRIVYSDGTSEDLRIVDMARRLLACYEAGKIELARSNVVLLVNCSESDMSAIMHLYNYVKSRIDLRTYRV